MCPRTSAVCLLAAFFLTVPFATPAASQDPHAADEPFDDELPLAVQQTLGERFAPVLVFHPREEFLPVSPLFALDILADDQREPAGALGSPHARRERYRALTLDEKVRLSTVYFRAYRARRDARPVVVVEYWMYYVQNAYRVRGGILPFWIDGSHPNDLEHIHLVLRHSENGLAPDEVWASSHDGLVPPNRYRYEVADDAPPYNGRFLVERGSHALAPDVDGDGIFTPGRDGDSGYRFLWGIRDHGVARTRYSRAYLDPEREIASITLGPDRDEAAADVKLTYRLLPVQDISRAFADLDLTKRERTRLFEVARHWLKRTFGADNGSSGKLLVPPARKPDARSESIGIGHIAASERGFLVGGTFKFQEQGAFVGARYAYLHDMPFLPDVIIEANATQTTKRNYLSAQLLFSYPIDASTKIMAGKAFVTDSWRFDRNQTDWYAGVEIRLGSMRISAAGRSWGPITNLSKEFRLAYFF
jgi:hypothetical protein